MLNHDRECRKEQRPEPNDVNMYLIKIYRVITEDLQSKCLFYVSFNIELYDVSEFSFTYQYYIGSQLCIRFKRDWKILNMAHNIISALCFM